MQTKKWIILTALEAEARAVAHGLAIPFIRGKLPRSMSPTGIVEIHIIGIRAVLLPRLLPVLTLSAGDRVLVAGLAGALDPSLHVGDLVFDRPDHSDLWLPESLRARSGKIHTSADLVTTPADKRALFEQTGALAVDMEQGLVRMALEPRGVHVIGFRAISDSAHTSLDPTLLAYVNQVGRPRTMALCAGLIRRPLLGFRLASLGIASARAMRALQFGIGAFGVMYGIVPANLAHS